MHTDNENIEYYVDYDRARCRHCSKFHRTEWVKADICHTEWEKAVDPIRKEDFQFGLRYVVSFGLLSIVSFALLLLATFQYLISSGFATATFLLFGVVSAVIVFLSHTKKGEYYSKLFSSPIIKYLQNKREERKNKVMAGMDQRTAEFVERGYEVQHKILTS